MHNYTTSLPNKASRMSQKLTRGDSLQCGSLGEKWLPISAAEIVLKKAFVKAWGPTSKSAE
jgi:hypothetical protein